MGDFSISSELFEFINTKLRAASDIRVGNIPGVKNIIFIEKKVMDCFHM